MLGGIRKLLTKSPKFSEHSGQVSGGEGLEVTVEVHDRTQFELDFGLTLAHKQSTGFWRRKQRALHALDIYVFLPPQLRFGKNQFTPELFYQDIRSHFRIREPRLKFRQLLGADARTSGISPLSRLAEEFRVLEIDWSSKGAAIALREAQMFACCFYGFAARKLRRLDRRKGLENADNWLAEAIEYTEQSIQVMSHWRKLYQKSTRVLAPDPKTAREFAIVDEYCSYVISEKLTELLSVCIRRKDLNGVAFDQLLNRLKALLRLERWHGRRCGYLFMSDHGHQAELERIYYRRRVLRRHIWSVLFVELVPRRFAHFRRQLGPMTAAFVAALWAGLANIAIFWWQADPASHAKLTTAILGLNGGMILVVSAVAYILKDRIKEIGRNYFSNGLISGRYDRSFFMEAGHSFREPLTLGVMSESASLQSLMNLPQHIQAIHRQHSFDTQPLGENYAVIMHHRDYLISSSLNAENSTISSGLKESCRYNIERFLPQLDDPVKKVVGFVGKGELREFDLPKVYYVDVAIEATTSFGKSNSRWIQYHRLTLTKQGLIARVQNLGVSGTESTEERAVYPQIGEEHYQPV
jgi:hypothetical protein